MNVLKSLEHIPANAWHHDHITIGTALVGAVSHICAKEIAATRADKEQTSDKPNIDMHPSDRGDALFLVDVGLFQKATKVKNRLGPLLSHMGPSIYFEHTSNVEASRETELALLQEEMGRRIVTISISKGGKDRVRIMSDPKFREERGRTELASFESVPFLWKHVTWRGKAMGRGGLMLPDSHTLAKGHSRRMQSQEKRFGDVFVRGTDPADFYEVKDGIRSLRSASPAEEAVRAAFSTENVGKIIAVSAHRDRMVDTVESHKWLERTIGRKVDFLIDPLRKKGDHAGITDHAALQLREIEKFLAGDSPRNDLLIHS